jgi:hypothetical protein
LKNMFHCLLKIRLNVTGTIMAIHRFPVKENTL